MNIAVSLDLSSSKRCWEFGAVLPLLDSSDHKKMCRNFCASIYPMHPICGIDQHRYWPSH